jgi:flagellar motor switch protein FliN/FliY
MSDETENDDELDMAAAMAEIEAEEAAKKAAENADDDGELDMAAAMAEIEAEEAAKQSASAVGGGGNVPGREASKEAIYDVPVEVSVVLGQADLRVHQLLKLGRGAVVELNRKTDEPVDVLADNILIARGEVTVTDDDKLGVTLSEIVRSLYTRAS